MKKKYIVTIVIALVAYFVWRRYGSVVKSSVTSLTS